MVGFRSLQEEPRVIRGSKRCVWMVVKLVVRILKLVVRIYLITALVLVLVLMWIREMYRAVRRREWGVVGMGLRSPARFVTVVFVADVGVGLVAGIDAAVSDLWRERVRSLFAWLDSEIEVVEQIDGEQRSR